MAPNERRTGFASNGAFASVGRFRSGQRNRPRRATTGCFDGPNVSLNVYDLNRTIAPLNSMLGEVGTGAFHVGVQVFGKEICFGAGNHPDDPGTGICQHEPRQHDVHIFRQSIPLGQTSLSETEVDVLLDGMSADWPSCSYDLLRKNCCSFADVFCRSLGVSRVPQEIQSLSKLAANVADKAAAIASFFGGTPRDTYNNEYYYEFQEVPRQASGMENIPPRVNSQVPALGFGMGCMSPRESTIAYSQTAITPRMQSSPSAACLHGPNDWRPISAPPAAALSPRFHTPGPLMVQSTSTMTGTYGVSLDRARSPVPGMRSPLKGQATPAFPSSHSVRAAEEVIAHARRLQTTASYYGSVKKVEPLCLHSPELGSRRGLPVTSARKPMTARTLW